MGSKGGCGYDFKPIEDKFKVFLSNKGYLAENGVIYFEDQMIALYTPRRDGYQGVGITVSRRDIFFGRYIETSRIRNGKHKKLFHVLHQLNQIKEGLEKII